MLKHLLIHPKINEVIAGGPPCPNLIADGTIRRVKRADAEVVCLNLMPASSPAPRCSGLCFGSAIDASTRWLRDRRPYALAEDPPVWDEYRAVIREAGLPLQLEPIFKGIFTKPSPLPTTSSPSRPPTSSASQHPAVGRRSMD